MKAVYVKVPFHFDIRDIEVPVPKPDEVLVKIEAGGICGSDVDRCSIEAVDYVALGHEVVGTVAEMGSNVHHLRKGDKVIIENCTPCGICERCKNGEAADCEFENWIYFQPQPGFAEYLCVHKNSLYPFDGLSFEEAALAEPLTVAMDLVDVAAISLNNNVAIFGPGPIGLMAVKLCKLRGAKNVYLIGLSCDTARLRAGREMGADMTLEADKVNVVDYFKKEAPRGVERILIAGPPKTLLDGVAIARYGAIISLIGIAHGGEEMVTLDINDFHFKKLQLRASFIVPNMGFPTALDLLKRKVIDPALLISHRFKMSEVEKAFRTMVEQKEAVIKVVLTP
ncbi:MAG: zinc-binding dehydrogenase [Spirochaetota bacterium]